MMAPKVKKLLEFTRKEENDSDLNLGVEGTEKFDLDINITTPSPQDQAAASGFTVSATVTPPDVGTSGLASAPTVYLVNADGTDYPTSGPAAMTQPGGSGTAWTYQYGTVESGFAMLTVSAAPAGGGPGLAVTVILNIK
jgi:hypothetical protein